jgi:RNA-binding protein NOB1
MDRLFCSKCGGSVLTRVAVSIDKRTGQLRLHLKQNYQVNLRGPKYSLPAPNKTGKQDAGLLLREDQLLSGIWKQKLNAMKSQAKKTMGGDGDMFSTGDVGFQSVKMSGGTGGGGLAVGYGKKNPNAMKGRERRGKKKRN